MPCRFGQRTVQEVIDQITNNDAELQQLDLTRNASFCMKAMDNTVALCTALKKNTIIKSVVLRECEIVDAGAQAIASVLKENNTIEELDLQQNKITTTGAILLADGLAKNASIRTLNLTNQSQKILGETCLEKFIAMFDTNITLTKVMWKVNSRRTWELSKLITRNVEIQRRAASGGDYTDLLPNKLRAPVGELPTTSPTPSTVSPQMEENCNSGTDRNAND